MFAPVSRYSSVRLLAGLAAEHDLDAHGLDVSNAFARADVDEDLYVEQPTGHEIIGPDGEPLVCKLNKGLYGTKQAARLWHETFRSHLVADGWIQYESDPCVFSRRTPKFGLEYLSIYVDDGIHLSERPGAHASLLAYCNKKFPTTTQGELHHILSMRVTRDRAAHKLWLDQTHGINAFLEKHDFPKASTFRAIATPMHEKWTYGDGDPVTDLERHSEFRSKASAISYFAQCTRPDISFATNQLLRYMHKPNEACFTALERLMRYLRLTASNGLEYNASGTHPTTLYGMCDSSWNPHDGEKGRSTGGYLIFYGKNLIDWSSKRQDEVCLSPAEAEQNAAFHAARTLVYFRQFLDELGYTQNAPSIIHEDNTACIAQSKNPVNHHRSRHIALQYHYLRELTKRSEVVLHHIETHRQLADALTKPLMPKAFLNLIKWFIATTPTTSPSPTSTVTTPTTTPPSSTSTPSSSTSPAITPIAAHRAHAVGGCQDSSYIRTRSTDYSTFSHRSLDCYIEH